MAQLDEISNELQTVYARLDALRGITSSTILLSGEHPERYRELIEQAYAALGRVETVVGELRAELEYQQVRLDEARDTARAEEPFNVSSDEEVSDD